MIIRLPQDFLFTNHYRKLNILSLILIVLSVFIILFKGLNLGVDFKGGTLIEIRTDNTNVNIGEIRQSFFKNEFGRRYREKIW